MKRKSRGSWIESIKSARYKGKILQKNLRCTDSQMRYHLHKHGLKLQPSLCYHTDDELVAIMARIPTVRALEEHLKFSQERVKDEVERRGLEWPYTKRKYLSELKPEVMEQLYKDNGYNWFKVADALGVSITTVSAYIKDHGVQSVHGTTKYPFTYRDLHFMYIEQGAGSIAIARAYGDRYGEAPTPRAILNALHRFGIPVRSPQEHKRFTQERGERGKFLSATSVPKFYDEVFKDTVSDDDWLGGTE